MYIVYYVTIQLNNNHTNTVDYINQLSSTSRSTRNHKFINFKKQIQTKLQHWLQNMTGFFPAIFF